MHSFRIERLFLRELQTQDCSQEYAGWLNDPRINRYLETRHQHQTVETCRAFVASILARDDTFLFGIFLNGKHIGNAKIGPIHPVHGVADISLLIGDGRGGGFCGADVIEGLARYAFAALGVRKVNASVYSQNRACLRAIKQTSFVPEGIRRGHYDLDGERADLHVFGMLPSDLASLTDATIRAPADEPRRRRLSRSGA